MRGAGDADDLESIRERKREELADRLGESDGADGGDGDAGGHDAPVHVEGQSHLADIVAEEPVVLVDFYADWCGPCKMLEPTLETVAADTDATVAKVDVDAHQALAGEYGVQGVPMLLLFEDGQPSERLVGVQDEATLRQLVAR